MKIKKITALFLTAVFMTVLSGCRFENEFTYEGIKFSVSRDYEHERTVNADIFRGEDAEIVIRQSESELRRLVNDKSYVDEYDVTYETDNAYINEIYYAVTHMERSELKDGKVRFKSIEYSFNVSGKNYIVLIKDVIDVIDIEPYAEELENIVNSIDVSWSQETFPEDI